METSKELLIYILEQLKELGKFLNPKSVSKIQKWTKKMSKNGKWKHFPENTFKNHPL
jgi:hypothetical protein